MAESVLTEPNPVSAGQILKASRLEQGLTLEQISKCLCIKVRNLSLLENDLTEDENGFTYDVYTLGFVRLYAQYLKLNAQEIVEKFKEQHANTSRTHEVLFSAPLPGRGMPSLFILALSFIALAAVIIGWKLVNHNTAPPSPPEVVVETVPQTTIPVEEVSADIEPTRYILETDKLRGEFPAFEDKVFPTYEQAEPDLPLSPEKWLEERHQDQ
jgi:cytoskeletal protein RodZ